MLLLKPKSTQLCLSRLIFWQNCLRNLSTTSSHCSGKVHDEEDDDKDQKFCDTKENQQDHLYLYKSKGQHLLTNTRILDAIVRRSNVRPTDTVLEIGPGTGNLTVKLLEAAKRVVAIEIDKRMVDILHKRVAEKGLQDRLHVICKDAMKAEFPQFDLVVANIPYGISSPLVAKLVYGRNPFRSATLLLQKEFARRLLAKPGDSEFNRLAVNVKLVADVEFVMDVSKREFLPCPKVDSSVVMIRPKAQVPDVNLDEWWAFTRTCFSKKNKTLGATFKQKKKVMELLKLAKTAMACKDYESDDDYDGDNEQEKTDEEDGFASAASDLEMTLFKEKIVGILRTGGFEDKRPSKLSNEELLHLLFLFNQAGIYFHDHVLAKGSDNVEFAAAYSS
ncbi:ribosomal RNA small subunit methyltransferase, mitochondrial [Herrania umbratica]|uniref:rRNA adenine N(6)-methyltransferase n=1 Tax=Herrania umbratica TaxID=108875 RepID=A0A6J0ZLN0_9ROSI|nr:ribosomal RNA small subunit methyltransferase, mitochondrial [Herrania umbratica]